jgi:hypothetical protein
MGTFRRAIAVRFAREMPDTGAPEGIRTPDPQIRSLVGTIKIIRVRYRRGGLCVPKTSCGDDFSFGRRNSQFVWQNSLLDRNNSLFCHHGRRQALLPPAFRAGEDCVINTSGHDFRKGQIFVAFSSFTRRDADAGRRSSHCRNRARAALRRYARLSPASQTGCSSASGITRRPD